MDKCNVILDCNGSRIMLLVSIFTFFLSPPYPTVSDRFGLIDSGGARIQEGVKSLGGYADIFRRMEYAPHPIFQRVLVLFPIVVTLTAGLLIPDATQAN
jgi:hypothetical protein